uniref:Uncharacterized protein n=1 Tax=Arundo donax TaxID=35708 RepID=A0A0A8Z0U5_ARUDO
MHSVCVEMLTNRKENSEPKLPQVIPF